MNKRKKVRLKLIDEGKCLSVRLPEECGYLGYSVRCIYKYNKKEQKIFMSMWLLRDDIDDEFRINSQEIDTQYLHGVSNCPERYIKNIIEYGSMSGYFNKYIKRLEYTYKCFDKGNEFYSVDTDAS